MQVLRHIMYVCLSSFNHLHVEPGSAFHIKCHRIKLSTDGIWHHCSHRCSAALTRQRHRRRFSSSCYFSISRSSHDQHTLYMVSHMMVLASYAQAIRELWYIVTGWPHTDCNTFALISRYRNFNSPRCHDEAPKNLKHLPICISVCRVTLPMFSTRKLATWTLVWQMVIQYYRLRELIVLRSMLNKMQRIFARQKEKLLKHGPLIRKRKGLMKQSWYVAFRALSW